MNAISTHSDSINNTPVVIVLNAPYETLAIGNSVSRGKSVKRFCNEHSSNYAKVVGEQVWASPFKGVLLTAFIDQHLPSWGLDASACLIYFPLDNAIYSIEVGEYGSCVTGSEAIISYEETLEPPSLPLHVLAGGELTAKFDNVVEIEGHEKLNDFNFSLINKELLRNRYFVLGHYASAAVITVLAAFVISTVTSELTDNDLPSVIDAFQDIVTPTGNDLAVSQLLFIDEVLKNDTRYFLGKGLHRFSYEPQLGITLDGHYPPAAGLVSLITDSRNVNLPLNLSQQGWQVSKYPEIEPRDNFDLAPFNQNILVLKQLAESHELMLQMNSPSADLDKRMMAVELSKSLNSRPLLAEMAKHLEGHSMALNSLEITFNDFNYESLKLTLMVTGRKS